MDLQIVWFVLLGILLAGYAVLDGFDLGVGILHPLAQRDDERRLFINAIGPIWDGNEVWLITFGGAMFAAFPEAYRTVFSGFYLALMLLLFCLILRAVSIEFRSKIASRAWRSFWDWSFFGSSLVASLLFGVAVGNVMVGIPLNENGVFTGTFWSLLGPYQLLVGALTVAMFAMHGAFYLYLKIPTGELHQRLHGWLWHTWGVFMVLYLLATIATLALVPRALAHFREWPWAGLFVLVNVLAVANIPRAIYLGKPFFAFASSVTAIMAMVALLGLALFPNLVTASNNPAYSLTIRNASSSPKTLQIMAWIALIGMPFVLSYTTAVYWTFRGRVSIDRHSY